jgi:hypothetical protein
MSGFPVQRRFFRFPPRRQLIHLELLVARATQMIGELPQRIAGMAVFAHRIWRRSLARELLAESIRSAVTIQPIFSFHLRNLPTGHCLTSYNNRKWRIMDSWGCERLGGRGLGGLLRLTRKQARGCNERCGEGVRSEATSRSRSHCKRGEHIVRSPGLNGLRSTSRPLIRSSIPQLYVAR